MTARKHRARFASPAASSLPAKSPRNRSLERGIEILRAFRPGSGLLGNGEIAERTGLSRSTVSRLTQTLLATGFLRYDAGSRSYALGAPVLSLANAMRNGSAIMRAAAPLIHKAAEAHRINVGLAVADRDEIVYLESVRYDRTASVRKVGSGQHVPMELTSLGRAYLAVIPTHERAALFAKFSRRHPSTWARLRRDINNDIDSVTRIGFCAVSWQPQVIALATPILVDGHPPYILNFSMTTTASRESVVRNLKGPLLNLAKQISAKLHELSDTD
jgi:DNA-binding IclR family transcriptional regulator